MDGKHKGWRKRREMILRRDGYICQQCGETEGVLHVDHIVPRRLNGSDDANNLQTLCKSCNLRKGGFFGERLTPLTLQDKDIPKNASVSHD